MPRPGIQPLRLLAAAALAFAAHAAHADRIKDLATLQGVRANQLVGYGLVVGLDGSGDQTTQAPFTTQSLINMLSQLGIQLPPGQSLQLKNIAAVMVTASLPPFARNGQQLDVTVSSVANAKSLRGGTLLMTPLKGADGRVYALAQGNVLVGGAGAGGGGAQVQINHLAAGRIAAGAIVERAVETPVGQGEFVHLELRETDFANAQKVAEAINAALGEPLAQPVDGRQIRVRAPDDAGARVAFLGRIENIEVAPTRAAARVVVNPRTGSVVMNQTVTLEPCAVAHGNLSVVIGRRTEVDQPPPLSGGQTVVTSETDVSVTQAAGTLMQVPAGVTLAEVVKALNALGAKPLDLLAILQAMKAAGALRAELEVI